MSVFGDKITKEEYKKLVGHASTKYHNKVIKDYFGKVQNHSKGEARQAEEFALELHDKNGRYVTVEEQHTLQLFVEHKHICDIKVDFYLRRRDGKIEIAEFKSEATKTPTWKIKWALLRALYPDFMYTVITA